jgi:multiple sugar transport system permease protein
MNADVITTASEAADLPRRSRSRFRPSPWHLVLIPITFVLLVPLLWMLATSLETEAETHRFPPVLVPRSLQWHNYADAWRAAPFGSFLLNSLIVSVLTVISTLVLCSLAGYAFARVRFAGRGLLFIVLMASLMVPFQVTMIPEFLIVKWLGLHVWTQLGIDHLGALIVPNLVTAFGIFFLRQFFLTIPIELEEAARMDGTSRLGVLIKIVLPRHCGAGDTRRAHLPRLVEFVPVAADRCPARAAHDPPMAGHLPGVAHAVEPAHAANVLSLLPMLVVFFAAQRYFVRSVAGTGLKG